MDIKKIIIVVAILIIILITAILFIILHNSSDKTVNEISTEHIATNATEDDPVEINEKLAEVTVRNNFYTVKNCITKFYSHCTSIYNVENDNLIKDEETINSLEYQKKQNIEAMYNILDKDYITYKNITLDNLTDKLPKVNKMTINITNMYVTQRDENISIYFVYGYLIDTTSAEITDFSIIVNVDMLNRTFNVMLEDYMKEKYENIEVGKSIDINYPNSIENNTYNTFQYQSITDATYITDVFDNFKNNLIYNASEIYNDLDSTYKNSRFPTLKSFEEYIKNKINDISLMKLSEYKKTKYDNYTQYVCLTTNNKYYIINELSLIKYNFILDTYTIDLPEFLEKYQNSDDKNKVALNIEKIKDAINDFDFQYVYNKLDSVFKKNNYPDYNKFVEYLKTNLYEKNTFEYKNIEKQGDVFVATIVVNNSKKLEIIMQLSDNTDFYISFNIE